MGRRRGFLAEIQHQSRLAEQRQRAAVREQDAAYRRAVAAQNAAQRAKLAASRASDADRKRMEKEAAAAHVAAMQAEVDQLNATLFAGYDELDSLLAATLEVDDYVDLESLRQRAEHPPFSKPNLQTAIPVPTPLTVPVKPTRRTVEKPTGLFGRKKKLAEADAQADAEMGVALRAWEMAGQALPARQAQQSSSYAAAERARVEELATEQARYEADCASREALVAKNNFSLDELIANLGYGDAAAIHEYVGIVIANSVYPDSFDIDHESEFEASSAELRLRVLVPGPDQIPTVKAYRYVKASDEITSAELSQKDAKDRYAGIVHQVALRSLHEVFEADRRKLIQAISLEVGTQTVSPATGNETYVPFVAVAVSREAFAQIELSAVVPAATLEHLGAALSKNPLGLIPSNGSGVRRS
ncbi:hypothetical protein GY21_11255 [Cryobacterium roopkundense]|uniref:Restriction system protein n=1 Tax=Cryobacterium roopkundense TaxID=1001240 RepID=A0A099J5Y0_9MICO|nr:hypothetical protein [Cryobacterium roopkundense]KGJ73480.1 hypothetical protein GY21_11255 [Cryobacterium roopkundense]MBB5641003.1 restriction system protein [Cryobacterium roopkundense]